MHRGREEERQTDGEESRERRVERQIGGEGKQARQSKGKKEKCKATEGGLGKENNDSMKEREKKGKDRKGEYIFLLLAGKD